MSEADVPPVETAVVVPARRQVYVAETELRAGALRLPAVLMQAITLIAPAVAVLFTFQFAVSQAGVAAPWLFIAVGVVVFMLAVALTQLARAFPSAGGYYTYISRTIDPRVGFIAAWLFILFTPPVSGTIIPFTSKVLETEFKAEYGFTFPWWAWTIIFGAFVTFVVYRGIELSAKVLVTLGLIEITIIVLLSLWGLFDSGPGGFSLAPFNPGNSINFTGFYTGAIFLLFAYTGWEGAAPLAEESENPRENVVKGTIGAMLIHGVIITFCTWALLVGWGVNDVDGLVNSKELPPFALAHQFWGGAWIVLLFALLNSTLAVSIAATNVSTRIWFKMGQTGTLPRAFGKVHPKWKTPVNALHLQLLFFLVMAFGVAFYLKPDVIWFFFGFIITYCLVPIYFLGNVGVLLYYWREKRSEFNWLLHGIFPVVSSVALWALIWKSSSPLPAEPLKWAPHVVGIWLLIGIAILVVMRLRGKEEYLLRAGEAVSERPETAEELAHRPVI